MYIIFYRSSSTSILFRFVDALDEATKVLHASQKVVPLFAPAHQLKFQILKINALTREAEYYCELLHPTLQECLQVTTLHICTTEITILDAHRNICGSFKDFNIFNGGFEYEQN